MHDRADPMLLEAWVRARSVVRGLPPPVHEHGGLRVDTGSPSEIRRHVFAGPLPGIRTVAAAVTTPRIPIKMCGPGDALLALVTSAWRLQPPSHVMTHDGVWDHRPHLPAGFRLELVGEHAVTAARILAEDGTLAASGYGVEHGGVFVFDRIVTEAAYRRIGLGRALVGALGSRQKSASSRRVLVATGMGRALYATMGWGVHAPYSTVVIEEA